MRYYEFINEDEYSAVQAKLGKDPNLIKVDANTSMATTPGMRKLMKSDELEQWIKRRADLQTRAQKIYSQLLSAMQPNERAAVANVKLDVPLDGEGAWAAANFADKKITLDVGTFWDLSNDCLAYTIGHEIGHMVYERANPGYYKKQVTPAQNRKLEMDADVYGALLAYKLGYNINRAWDHFTEAYQREPFDPKYPEYPSVGQRKSNVNRALSKQRKDASISHVMQGLQHFQTVLAANPEMANNLA